MYLSQYQGLQLLCGPLIITLTKYVSGQILLVASSIVICVNYIISAYGGEF